MKREREEELIFRGRQYKDAFTSWYKTGTGIQPLPLKDLKDLLQDPRSPSPKRYLRRLYTDPMTGKEWTVFSDQKGISAVASTSQETPLKTGGFPEDLKNLDGKQKYSQWIFGKYSAR
jgi:hypothetical protein